MAKEIRAEKKNGNINTFVINLPTHGFEILADFLTEHCGIKTLYSPMKRSCVCIDKQAYNGHVYFGCNELQRAKTFHLGHSRVLEPGAEYICKHNVWAKLGNA